MDGMVHATLSLLRMVGFVVNPIIVVDGCVLKTSEKGVEE